MIFRKMKETTQLIVLRIIFVHVAIFLLPRLLVTAAEDNKDAHLQDTLGYAMTTNSS